MLRVFTTTPGYAAIRHHSYTTPTPLIHHSYATPTPLLRHATVLERGGSWLSSRANRDSCGISWWCLVVILFVWYLVIVARLVNLEQQFDAQSVRCIHAQVKEHLEPNTVVISTSKVGAEVQADPGLKAQPGFKA